MTTELLRRLLLACAVVVATSILWATPSEGQRWWHQGDTWLKWKHDVREGYVFGYIVAYSNGHEDGCKDSTKSLLVEAKSANLDDLQRNCNQHDLDFSQGTEYFVKLITEFYKRYPEDREIGMGEVLRLMGTGLTLEQIHNHPFPRHNPPSAKR